MPIAPLSIHLFGPMRAFVDGLPLPKVRSQKARWLLALLALRSGGPVPRSFLASTLWSDAEPLTALTNLRSVVSDLRRALGDQAGRLQTPDRRTLVLDLADAEVDLLDFDAALKAGDRERAAALYVAPLLEDCDEEWAAPERAMRERALLRLLNESMADASPEQAVELARLAVRTAPWQDAPRRDLMNALARTGDLNAALVAYREFATALRAETGGKPDLPTTDLYVRLRSGEFEAPSEAPVAGALPHPITSFVGREDECSEIVRDLETHRLVTLLGLGGVGKTRLAQEVAQTANFPGGVWFVPLEAIHDEGGVQRAVVAALRLKESQDLVDAIRPRRLLIVLDNCEHLIAACARLSERLLGEVPGLRILATSREPLGIVGEKVWRVPGLTIPHTEHLPEQPTTLLRVMMGYEAVRLFVERAAIASGFALTRENARIVAELCEMLEGLPLALELAACRTRTMNVGQILKRLRERRLDVLEGNRRTGIPRHQTVRAALDWSYSLLDLDERRLFARLAVFSGGWTLDAARAVADATPEGLASLVEKSLITFSGTGRYGQLETVREYAAERLDAFGDRSRTEARHLVYFTELAERWEAEPSAPEAFEREMANFRAALDREDGDAELGLRLAAALGVHWREIFAVVEGAHRMETALRRAGPKPTSLRARALRLLGRMRFEGEPAAGIECYEASLEVWRSLGDRAGEALALHSLGRAAFFEGEFGRAWTLLEESLTAAREVGDDRLVRHDLGIMSVVSFRRGNYEQAKVLIRESADLFRRHGQAKEIAWSLRTLGALAHDLGDYDAMRRHNQEALALFRTLNDEDGIAWCRDDLGRAATELGQLALGQDLLEQALDTMRRLEDPFGTASVLETLGYNALARGRREDARLRFQESLALFRSLQHRQGIARALDGLGDALDAPDFYRETLAVWSEIGDQKRIRDTLLRLGVSIMDPKAAIQILACAERMSAQMGIPVPLPLKPRLDRALATLRTRKGFESAWKEGIEMPLTEALRLALIL